MTSLLLASSSESQEQWPFFLKPSLHLASHTLVGGREMGGAPRSLMFVWAQVYPFSGFEIGGAIVSSIGPLSGLYLLWVLVGVRRA